MKDKQEAWINYKQWLDDRGITFIYSELNSKEDSLTDEEYFKQQLSIRELMELNMVLYGKW